MMYANSWMRWAIKRIYVRRVAAAKKENQVAFNHL
jgi:hypothetical protein